MSAPPIGTVLVHPDHSAVVSAERAAAEQAQALRDAAEVITGCAELETPLYAEDGTYLGTLTKALARPIAAGLRGSAELIERSGHSLGLPVSYDLELAGLVLSSDLGHNR